MKKLSLKNVKGSLSRKEMRAITGGYGGLCHRQGGESFGGCFSREVSYFCNDFIGAVAFSTNPAIGIIIAGTCSC